MFSLQLCVCFKSSGVIPISCNGFNNFRSASNLISLTASLGLSVCQYHFVALSRQHESRLRIHTGQRKLSSEIKVLNQSRKKEVDVCSAQLFSRADSLDRKSVV